MEPTLLISEDLRKPDALEHSGVKGMKWGVWNAETRRKYMGGKGRPMSAKVKEVGKKGSEAVAKFASNRVSDLKTVHAKHKAASEQKKQAKEDVKEQRKELGMTRAQYNKLREKTLQSHDPRVVERGMRTLTDAELDSKLTRLRKEEEISKMSTSLSTRKHNEHKARSDAISANPLVKFGTDIAKGKINSMLNSKGNSGKQNDNAEPQNQGKAEDIGTAKKLLVKRSPSPYSSTDVNDAVRKVVKESAVKNASVNSDTAKSAADRGKRMLTDGILEAKVVSVETVPSSTPTTGEQKLLPAARK